MHDSTFGIIPVRKENGKNVFLLIKSRSGHWNFPKGHAHHGETSIETAKRELEEETGISNIQLLSKNSFSETRLHVDPERTITKTTLWFIGLVNSTAEISIKDTDEVIEYQWLRFDDAYTLLSYDETKRVFLDARLYLAKNGIEEAEASHIQS